MKDSDLLSLLIVWTNWGIQGSAGDGIFSLIRSKPPEPENTPFPNPTLSRFKQDYFNGDSLVGTLTGRPFREITELSDFPGLHEDCHVNMDSICVDKYYGNIEGLCVEYLSGTSRSLNEIGVKEQDVDEREKKGSNEAKEKFDDDVTLVDFKSSSPLTLGGQDRSPGGTNPLDISPIGPKRTKRALRPALSFKKRGDKNRSSRSDSSDASSSDSSSRETHDSGKPLLKHKKGTPHGSRSKSPSTLLQPDMITPNVEFTIFAGRTRVGCPRVRFLFFWSHRTYRPICCRPVHVLTSSSDDPNNPMDVLTKWPYQVKEELESKVQAELVVKANATQRAQEFVATKDSKIRNLNDLKGQMTKAIDKYEAQRRTLNQNQPSAPGRDIKREQETLNRMANEKREAILKYYKAELQWAKDNDQYLQDFLLTLDPSEVKERQKANDALARAQKDLDTASSNWITVTTRDEFQEKEKETDLKGGDESKGTKNWLTSKIPGVPAVLKKAPPIPKPNNNDPNPGKGSGSGSDPGSKILNTIKKFIPFTNKDRGDSDERSTREVNPPDPSGSRSPPPSPHGFPQQPEMSQVHGGPTTFTQPQPQPRPFNPMQMPTPDFREGQGQGPFRSGQPQDPFQNGGGPMPGTQSSNASPPGQFGRRPSLRLHIPTTPIIDPRPPPPSPSPSTSPSNPRGHPPPPPSSFSPQMNSP